MENETNDGEIPKEEIKPLDPSIKFTSPLEAPKESPNFPVQPEPQTQTQPTGSLESPMSVIPTPPQPEIVPRFNQPVNSLEVVSAVQNVKYAGFWIRWVANFIDGIVLGIPLLIIFLPIGFILATSMGLDKAANLPWPINLSIRLLEAIIGWTYYIFMTNKYQATLGKMAVGIKVVSDKAEDLTSGQIILRETLGKFLSGITLGIGYIMAGFTERKQALHDMMAKTTVIYKDPNKKMSGCVIAAVVLACILPIIAIIGILASIILVSLGSAKGKAQDTAIKAEILSRISEAPVYFRNHSSYSGFAPNFKISPSIISCSGQPIVNVSPNGNGVAILGKLCSDPKKYFCADSDNKSGEVDESATKMGSSSCNDMLTDNR
jgi:uncharacterized RDD family membrane protein YckC